MNGIVGRHTRTYCVGMDGKPAGLEEAFSLDANPSYRVEFFADSESPDSESPERWQLVAASSVHEALTWAEEHRNDRGYILYAEWRDLEGYMLLSRLAEDPPKPEAR